MRDLTNIATIAKETRAELKREFPECKFSVTIERYSMGQALTVALMAAPYEVFKGTITEVPSGFQRPINPEYEQINTTLRDTYAEAEARRSNVYNLTKWAYDTLRRASEIANRRNWDYSDVQTDYFDNHFVFHLSVGKWNKPFTFIEDDSCEDTGCYKTAGGMPKYEEYRP
jgi:hypothetical protein